MNKILAIIPARGGSKGVPKKNIRIFNGMPLIGHSIYYAKKCCQIDRIIVSTDSKEISDIALSCGAEVVKRPKSISGDKATTESAIKHVLNNISTKPDIIVLLQPTSPYRPKNSLDKALEIFNKNEYDSLLSISPSHNFFWKISGAIATPQYDYKNRLMRQDIKKEETTYIENGSLYIFKYKHFMDNHNRLGGKIGYTVFPEKYSLEIDSHADLTILETLVKEHKE